MCFQFPSVDPKKHSAKISSEPCVPGQCCSSIVQEPSVGSGTVEMDPTLAVPSSISLNKLQDFLPNLILSFNNYSSGSTLIFGRSGLEVCHSLPCLLWQHHPIPLYPFLPFMEKSFSCHELGLFPSSCYSCKPLLRCFRHQC